MEVIDSDDPSPNNGPRLRVSSSSKEKAADFGLFIQFCMTGERTL